jgi:hypothetical protein
MSIYIVTVIIALRGIAMEVVVPTTVSFPVQ